MISIPIYVQSSWIYYALSKLPLTISILETSVPTIEESGNGGKTIGYIYCGGTPAGIFALSDACRLGAAEAVRELKEIGIKTALLTGDSHTAAIHTNEQVRIYVHVSQYTLYREKDITITQGFSVTVNHKCVKHLLLHRLNDMFRAVPTHLRLTGTVQ